MTTATQFYTKSGLPVEGISLADYERIHTALAQDYGISPLQTCEAASFSFAMVVRSALGLSASGGKICALVNDSLAGWTVLAAARHLINAGSELHVVFLMDPVQHSSTIEQVLLPLEKMGATLDHWSVYPDTASVSSLLSSAHNVLCGLFSPSLVCEPVVIQYIDILNESPIPVHAIEAPLGINPDTGAPLEKPLYASSTLSLGAPLKGLKPGHDFVGRHYLCDVSFPRALLESAGASSLCGIFAEQPVIQILPEQRATGAAKIEEMMPKKQPSPGSE